MSPEQALGKKNWTREPTCFSLGVGSCIENVPPGSLPLYRDQLSGRGFSRRSCIRTPSGKRPVIQSRTCRPRLQGHPSARWPWKKGPRRRAIKSGVRTFARTSSRFGASYPSSGPLIPDRAPPSVFRPRCGNAPRPQNGPDRRIVHLPRARAAHCVGPALWKGLPTGDSSRPSLWDREKEPGASASQPPTQGLAMRFLALFAGREG